jgi:hypothetical protein
MQKKNLLISVAVFAVLFAASLFGFSAAYGYGGSGGGISYVSTCSNVTYGDWGACANGVQYRNVLSQTPNYCTLSASQQSERSRACSGSTVNPGTTPTQAVLGAKVYADGSLLRGPDGKIYVVVGGTLQHIMNQATLARYVGKKVVHVDATVIASFKQTVSSPVRSYKYYPKGELLRSKDTKIFVIVDGKKYHIMNLVELSAYYGRKITNVSDAVIAQYPTL